MLKGMLRQRKKGIISIRKGSQRRISFLSDKPLFIHTPSHLFLMRFIFYFLFLSFPFAHEKGASRQKESEEKGKRSKRYEARGRKVAEEDV